MKSCTSTRSHGDALFTAQPAIAQLPPEQVGKRATPPLRSSGGVAPLVTCSCPGCSGPVCSCELIASPQPWNVGGNALDQTMTASAPAKSVSRIDLPMSKLMSCGRVGFMLVVRRCQSNAAAYLEQPDRCRDRRRACTGPDH